MSPRSATALLWLSFAALGCGDSPESERPISEWVDHSKVGGQSGGEGSIACEHTPQPLATATQNGVRIADVLPPFRASFETSAPFAWRPIVREPTPIPDTQLELTELEVDGWVGVSDFCESYQLPIRFRARTTDGLFEGRFEGQLIGYTRGGSKGNLQLFATMRDGQLLELVRAGLADGAELFLRIYWPASGPENTSGTLEAGPQMQPIGWIGRDGVSGWTATQEPPKDRTSLAPSELQRRSCQGLLPTALATFPTEAAMHEALSKTWVMCEGTGRVAPDFGGLSVDATGRWHELRVEGDALVAVQGFGHEGQLARNVYGTDFNLAILDWLPQRYEFAHAELSADGRTLRVITQHAETLDATFRAVELPVRYPTPLHPRGTRAGLAACEEPEADVTSRPASEAALRELLLGRWLFCRGSLGSSRAGIQFAADGSYRYLEADGRETQDPVGMYTIVDTSSFNGPGAYQVNLFSEPGNGAGALSMPIISHAPLKLRSSDEDSTELTAF